MKLHGRVVTADGHPPQQGQAHVRIKEPGLRGQIEQGEIVIDSEGRFEFELCEGVTYSAFAFSGRPPYTTYSAPAGFIPTEEKGALILTLDKTGAQFHSLHPK